MRSLFIFAKHTRARESICICTCHALCRLLDCTTIMSSYLTIQFVVNARASKLQVMLAPPTKDIFLGLRQQVCSLLSQLYGWFLHTCNLTAWWKTQGTKYHITWKSALLWPNLLGLFCQNPLQVTVFCCLKQTTRWYTVSDTLIVDLRRNIIRVGSTRSALYLFQTPPTPQITTATTAAGSPRRKACPRHEEDMTILSVGLPLLDLYQARTCKRKAWSIRSWLLLELFWILLNYIELIEFYNVNELTLTPSRWFLLHHRYKGSIYI